MAVLELLHYPDERLHLKAKPITEFNEGLVKLFEDMAETMYKNNGIGLAATQVNVQKQMFIMDLAREGEKPQLKAFVNPKILSKNGESEYEEGCLSVPGIFETVKRAQVIEFEYQDLQGNIHNETCDGLKAVCIQHEYDHLQGKVFVEYLSNLKQNFIKKKLKKAIKN